MSVINITINSLAELDEFYNKVKAGNVCGTVVWVPNENGKKLLDVLNVSESKKAEKPTVEATRAVVTDTVEPEPEVKPEPKVEVTLEPKAEPEVTAQPKVSGVFGNLSGLLNLDVAKVREERESSKPGTVLEKVISTIGHDNRHSNKVFVSAYLLRSLTAKVAVGKVAKHNYGDGNGPVETRYTDEENKAIDDLLKCVIHEGQLIKIGEKGFIIPVQSMVKYGKGFYDKLRYDDKADVQWTYIIDLRDAKVTIHNNNTGKDVVRPYCDSAVERINRCGRFVGGVD